ncbi:hypothetical protein, partial [Streptomyces eurythermus]|uniref:hypothetical protein n=1 Tax=Streptomyces eurythermus TaxID=42237 RepID=UPI0033F168D5
MGEPLREGADGTEGGGQGAGTRGAAEQQEDDGHRGRAGGEPGQGGIAYVLKNDHKLDLPRRMQIEFSRIIQ